MMGHGDAMSCDTSLLKRVVSPQRIPAGGSITHGGSRTYRRCAGLAPGQRLTNVTISENANYIGETLIHVYCRCSCSRVPWSGCLPS